MFKTKTSLAGTRETLTLPSASQKRYSSAARWLILLDLLVLSVMGTLLFWGTSTQFSNSYNDMTRYQYYAIAFWQGQAGLQAHNLATTLPSQSVFPLANVVNALLTKAGIHNLSSFVTTLLDVQSTTQPFHTLPTEYPLLTLLFFSLPLLVPFFGYQIIFALLMTLVAVLLYIMLSRSQGRSAAIACAFYLVLGSWATATDRFDLVPAILTLGAVLLTGKARWKWAFALLALATLYKFYPVMLAIPFLIKQQEQFRGRKVSWISWKRWSAILCAFVGLGMCVTLVSLTINVNSTLTPFIYFLKRPFQVESWPATLLWLGGHLGITFQYAFTYQSLNIVSPLAHIISPLIFMLECSGLAYAFWLQWRGKLSIAEVSLLTVLIIIITGKVFSPQYLIWVTPLIALVGKANWKWLLTWGLVGALTTFMFPLHYNSIGEIDQFYPVIIARDLLVLGLTCALLYWYSQRKSPSMIALVGVEEVEAAKPLSRQ